MWAEILVSFSGAGIAALLTAGTGMIVWKATVSIRLDHIEEGIAEAVESRRDMHKFMRKIERRLDKAGINGG